MFFPSALLNMHDLRAALNNDTADSVHSTFTNVRALVLDLHHPALEVLLVEQEDLQEKKKQTMTTYFPKLAWFCGYS